MASPTPAGAASLPPGSPAASPPDGAAPSARELEPPRELEGEAGEERAQEFNDVSQLEITYVDPDTSQIKRRLVYSDVGRDWLCQARFLVSSDLINLLSDTNAIRQGRFETSHAKLRDERLRNFLDLFRLRQNLERLVEKLNPSKPASEEVAENDEGTKDEIGPVHFFLTETYIDAWTKDRLKRALKMAQADLNKACKELIQKLRLLGGGSWRQLLNMILDSGDKSLEELVKMVMASVKDQEEQVEIHDKVTGGLRTKYDQLMPKIQDLEAQIAEYEETGGDAQAQLRRLEIQIDKVDQRRRDLLTAFKESKEAQAEQEAEDRRIEEARSKVAEAASEAEKKELEAKKKALFDEWKNKKESAKGAVQHVQNLFDQVKLSLDEEKSIDEKSKDGPSIAEFDRKVRVLKIRKERLQDKGYEIQDERTQLKAVLEEKREAVKEMEEEIAAYETPPDMTALKAQKLKRQVKKAQKEGERIKEASVKPFNKVQAIKYQLKKMYAKLDWEWPFSDDEDDGEKPYWFRRKMAANGLAPFDPRLFLNREEEVIIRHRTIRAREGLQSQQARFLSSIEGNRNRLTMQALAEVQQQTSVMSAGQLMSSVMSSNPLASDGSMMSAQVDINPFADDGLMPRGSTASQRLLIGSRGSQRDSRILLQSAMESEMPGALVERIRSDLRANLQRCAVVMADLLPPDAKFGGPRLLLARMLEDMELMPQDPTDYEERQICQKLVDTSAALRAMFDEISSAPGGPDSAPLPPSPEVDELRQMIEWSAVDAQDLQIELSSLPEPGAARWSSPPPSAGDAGAAAGKGNPRFVPPPRASEQQLEPLLRGARLRRGQEGRLRTAKGTDFGFRPDGGGEESLEKWSLFKVSKNRPPTSSGPSSATWAGPQRDSSGREKEDPKAVRYKQFADKANDFQEYMSRLNAVKEADEWRAERPPPKQAAKPSKSSSLPQLVKADSKVPAAVRLKGLHASRSRTSLGIDSA